MVRWVRFGAVLAVGWAASGLWAYGIAGSQPGVAERWGAVLAVAAVLAVLARRWSVAGLAAVWVSADLLLDRIDLGRPVLLPAAIFAGGLVTAAAVVLREPAPPRRRGWPGAGWVSAATLGVTAVVVLDAPAEAEPQLSPAGLAACGLLAVAALIAGLIALPVVAVVALLSGLPVEAGPGLVAVAAFWAALAWVGAMVAADLRTPSPAPGSGPAAPIRPPGGSGH